MEGNEILSIFTQPAEQLFAANKWSGFKKMHVKINTFAA